MFDSPAYYIVMSVILIALIVLLVRMIIQRRKEEKIFQEYMAEMDARRKLVNEAVERHRPNYRTYREKQEAERRAPANPQSTYYTTYNEREEDLQKDLNSKKQYPQRPDTKIPDWVIYIAIAILVIFLYENGIKLI